jgi:hypothetical protein
LNKQREFKGLRAELARSDHECERLSMELNDAQSRGADYY